LSSLLCVHGSCPFVDRERELEALDRAYRSRPAFIVVYGRRRIGKTRLVREWLQRSGARGAYYLAQIAGHQYNLRLMSETLSRQLGDPLIARLSPRRLGDLLLLASRSGAEVVVIDEFTYWARSDSIVLSELQEFVDGELADTGLLLVITGSLIGVMESYVLGGASPLYARTNYRLRLAPLKPWEVSPLLPMLGPADIVRTYALVGGIPFYLCLLRGSKNIGDVVRTLIVAPGAPLRDEKDLLLREELREPRVYSTILSALARGLGRPSQIAQVTGLEEGHVRKYLHVMESLGFVRRDVPLFKKKGRYIIADPVLRAWYSLVEPVVDLLELGRLDEAYRIVMGRLDGFVSPVWEDIARSYLLARHSSEGYTLTGRLEHKGEEIDVAVVDPDGRRAIIAEAKWSDITPRSARQVREQALLRAARLLPKGYTVAGVYVFARSVKGGEKPPWIFTAEDVLKPPE